MNNDGRLTRDGFAVAMHLIQKKLAGQDIPASLPPSLIPPSMRTPTPATATAAAQPSVSDSLRDLIWDDTPPSSATFSPPIQQTPLQPQSTGTLSAKQTPVPSFPQAPRTVGSPDPFTSSSFGSGARKSSIHHLITHFNSASTASSHKDLLGDDDEPSVSSPPLHDKSAEIGNVKNQLESTNRSLETTKTERTNVERTLAEQAVQLSALQTQLSSAKAAYETETRLFTTLRERFTAQSADLQKARQDLIHSESDLSAVRVEKAEIEGSVLRDKEEIRELHRKMAEVDAQLKGLKAEVEKAKKDAKQQKGMLAIAKKQLATREAERAKAEKELEEAQKERDEAIKEREEAEAALQALESAPQANGTASPDILAAAISQPLPASPPEPRSSTPSVSTPSAKSTNPFERLALASPTAAPSAFLPFTGSAVLPSPPTATSAHAGAPSAEEDPFGLSQFTEDEPYETLEAQAQTPVVPGGFSIDSAPSAVEPPTREEQSAISPTDTELFSTPPSTAVPAAPIASAITKELDDDATARFPALDATVAEATASEGQGKPTSEESELGYQIKEIEEEDESDTESEDNEPLSTVKTKLGENANAPSSAVTELESTTTGISAFDDSFGVTTLPNTPQVASPVQSITSTPNRSQSPSTAPAPTSDPFGLPVTATHALPTQSSIPAPALAPEPVPQTNGKVAEAGVSDFDEAMGKLPSEPSSGLPSQFSQFSFDSAFDDNFDFAAASAATNGGTSTTIPPPGLSSSFPPPPAVAHTSAPFAAPAVQPVPSQNGAFDSVFMTQPTSNGAPLSPVPANSTQVAPQQEAKPSFDDVFGSSTESHASNFQSGPSDVSHSISFDDAFGGADTSQALALGQSTGSTKHQPPAGSPSRPAASAAAPFPGSTPSSPGHATDQSHMTARRSISPPLRQTSPPPRHSSPRPRTGSSDKAASKSKLSVSSVDLVLV